MSATSLLLRLLTVAAPAALLACGSGGDSASTGTTSSSAGGSAGSSAGSGGAPGGSGGAAGTTTAGAGGQTEGCKEGEKRMALQFCPTSSCSDVMWEICSQNTWSCHVESCPPVGGAGGIGGAAGNGGGGAAGNGGGGAAGGAGAYTEVLCPENFCGEFCAKTLGSCAPDGTTLGDLFAGCSNQNTVGQLASATTDSAGVTTCCWWNQCPGGRPLQIDGAWTQAPVARRGDWG